MFSLQFSVNPTIKRMAMSPVSPSPIFFKVTASSLPFCETTMVRASNNHFFKNNPFHSRIFSYFSQKIHNGNSLQSKVPVTITSRTGRKSSGTLLCRAGGIYNVEIEHEGKKHVLQVPEDETILSKALDAGIAVPHDCKLGVCMTCPAKLIGGEVDQSEGMLSDDVVEKGYALMCSSYPRSDCSIRTIPEDELLSLQLATASD
uniref:Ferredoxin n=3 Tax=Pinaceae TaxID=3318 RepID=B8LMM2_PICSI|nr:unknown [Picea sitchensis]